MVVPLNVFQPVSPRSISGHQRAGSSFQRRVMAVT
jgi:hypothetical protein